MNQSKTGSKGVRIWLPLIFALVMIVGMWLGFKLHNTLSNKKAARPMLLRDDRLAELIGIIDEYYVDSVNTNQLYTDAIAGILSHLDPHTSYISKEDVARENEALDGHFYGIGVEFSLFRDTIYITKVIDEGPADKVGLDIGDQILKIGDSLVAGVAITSERIINMLKGQQYAPVILRVHHAASKVTNTLAIKRDEVPIYSIDASYLLDSATGYIKINRFSATTYSEFAKALELLKQKGATQLVIDVRGNPGGYLDEATAIVDEFIDDEKLIVYTQGRNRDDRKEVHALNLGLLEQGKVIVLIDELSASASEILAGALQDWDRGVIIGRQSYGKGLVEQQFELQDGSIIRLTTARYYTPSGRSIQRSFANGKEAYFDDYAKRLQAGWSGTTDSLKLPLDTTVYYTANHRKVYAKGGITPDVIVPPDSGKITQTVLDIIYSPGFKEAVRSYFLNHREALKLLGSLYTFKPSFQDEKVIIKHFFDGLSSDEQKKYSATFRHPKQLQYLMLQAKAQLAQLLYGDNGYYYILGGRDNVILKAVQVINQKNYSKLIGG